MDNTASFLIGDLAVGVTEMIEITLLINSDASALSLTNYAEIASVSNGMDLDDQDSTPGDNQGLDESGSDDDIDDEFPGTPGEMDNDQDNDDYDLAIIPLCDIVVDAGNPQSTCSTTPVTLSGNISPVGTPGTWSSSGDGTFSEDSAGTMPSTAFGAAAFYQSGAMDATRGTVTLTLTTGGDWLAVSETVEITILKVDCGTFPWGGQR